MNCGPAVFYLLPFYHLADMLMPPMDNTHSVEPRRQVGEALQGVAAAVGREECHLVVLQGDIAAVDDDLHTVAGRIWVDDRRHALCCRDYANRHAVLNVDGKQRRVGHAVTGGDECHRVAAGIGIGVGDEAVMGCQAVAVAEMPYEAVGIGDMGFEGCLMSADPLQHN